MKHLFIIKHLQAIFIINSREILRTIQRGKFGENGYLLPSPPPIQEKE